MTPDQQESAIRALHDAVIEIRVTLNDGLMTMVAEQRAELKLVNVAVQQIRDQVSSHIAKEGIVFEIFRKTLGLGITVTGALLLTLLAAIGWLLTHPNTWLN